jgi:glycine cleavage system H protein
MRDPAKMRFTDTHEWVAREGGLLVVGITDYAQMRLSDVTHVELPEPDDHHCEAGEDLGVLESLQSAMEYHAPVAGRVMAINNDLLVKPELVNTAPFGEGWLFKMKADDPSDMDGLMDFDEYDASLPEEEEEE